MSATDTTHVSIDKETIKTAQEVSKQVADFLHSIINDPRKLDQLKLMLIGVEKVKHLDKQTQKRFFDYYESATLEEIAPIFRSYADRNMAEITALICQLPVKLSFLARHESRLGLLLSTLGFIASVHASPSDDAKTTTIQPAIQTQQTSTQGAIATDDPKRSKSGDLDTSELQDQLQSIALSDLFAIQLKSK